MQPNVLQSNVNAIIAILCVGTFAFGAWWLVWQAAFGTDPIADAMEAQLVAELR